MKVLLLAAALLLASCATERVAVAVDAKVDSALTAAGLPPLAVHKLTLTGPITIQVGQGNTASQVGTDKTGQRAQAVSTGAGSPIQASQQNPWWVFLLVAIVGAAGWEWLSHRGLLAWLPWRVRPS